MIAEADTDHDGKISLAEFKHMLLGINAGSIEYVFDYVDARISG